MEQFIGKEETIQEVRYIIRDKKIDHDYPAYTEKEMKFYLFQFGIVHNYSEAMKLSLAESLSLLANNNHSVRKVGVNMDKHIIKRTDGPEVELFFFELVDKSYKELHAMLDDYLDLYNAFNNYEYRMNAIIIMNVLNTKKAKEAKLA